MSNPYIGDRTKVTPGWENVGPKTWHLADMSGVRA